MPDERDDLPDGMDAGVRPACRGQLDRQVEQLRERRFQNAGYRALVGLILKSAEVGSVVLDDEPICRVQLPLDLRQFDGGPLTLGARPWYLKLKMLSFATICRMCMCCSIMTSRRGAA